MYPPQQPPPGQPPGPPSGQQPQPPPMRPKPPYPVKDIPLNTGEDSHQPTSASIKFDTGPKKKISEGGWNALSTDLYQSIVSSDYGARSALNQNLQEWSDAYDMITYQKDTPFDDSSNLQLPYMTSQVDSLVAYVGGTVMQPRLILVTGNTSEAAKHATQLEKSMNAEVTRLRSDGTSYHEACIRALRLAMRDGTSVFEVLWARNRRRRTLVTNTPQIDDEGDWVTDENGDGVYQETRTEVDDYVKDYAQITPIPLKEFGLIPAEAASIEDAAACWRVEWLYEEELNNRIRAGIFDSDEVERALTYVPSGTSDVPADPAGTYDKTASYQIGIGMSQGSLSSEFFKNRGPIKVRRIHSRQYDMNGDGVPEENIFWLHEQSQRLLGWTDYSYTDGRRPFFACRPFPRSDGFLGYSVPERLSGVQTELDTMNNERRDAISQRLISPMMVEKGSELLNRKGEYGIEKLIEVERVSGHPQGPSFSQLTLPDVPLASFQDEALVKSYGDEYTGLGQPAMGGASSGRRSATELRQRNSAQGTRLDLICKEFRTTLIQVFNFVHSLNKQYLQTPLTTGDGPDKLVLPLEVLALDYSISVVGATDPIDSITRRNENMSFIQMVGQMFPFVMQDPVKAYRLGLILFDSFGRSDASSILGTEEEAKQRGEQQAQQQAQMQQMQMAESQARIAHGTPGPSQTQQRPQQGR